MTKKQMEALADMIVEKLMVRQQALEDSYMQELKENNGELEGPITISEDELAYIEVRRLNELLSQYEIKEEYEKAAIIKNKISKLKRKFKL